jgi:hypothetical protein
MIEIVPVQNEQLSLLNAPPLACGVCQAEVNKYVVCVYCYDDLETQVREIHHDRRWELEEIAALVDQVGDSIRDRIGDPSDWWQALRDAAIDMRTLGQEAAE